MRLGIVNREQLLGRVDGAWREFSQACHGLPSQAVLEPGVVGRWSVKDVMGHVATWEEECLSALALIAEGSRTPRYSRYGGIDAFNEMKWREFRALGIEDTRRRFEEAHARLLDYLGAVPEGLFTRETRFRRRVRMDTYGHIPEHSRQLVAWRRARGL